MRYYSSARSKIRCSLGWGQSHDFDRLLYRDLDGLRYEDPFGGATGFQDLAIGASDATGGMLLTRSGDMLTPSLSPANPTRNLSSPEVLNCARWSGFDKVTTRSNCGTPTAGRCGRSSILVAG